MWYASLRLSHVSQTNSVLHVLLCCASSYTPCQPFSLGPVKTYTVSAAPVLSQHAWSKPVAEELFTRPFATHQRIIPKSCAIPDRGSFPSFFRIYRSNLIEEKHFQSREHGYTPVTTCRTKKKKPYKIKKTKNVLQWDTSLEQRNTKYLS